MLVYKCLLGTFYIANTVIDRGRNEYPSSLASEEIKSVSKYLLSTYHMPGSVSGVGQKVVTTAD